MNLLNVMATYARVVETGSFTAVAKEQGAQQPAISKQIAWLEDRLGSRLIERSTRRLVFTDQALAYYGECKAILDAVLEAERGVRNEQARIAGNIRISASVGFGTFQIAPHVPAFIAEHPDVTVDLRLSDSYVDAVADGIDIAFRLGLPDGHDLVSRQLSIVHPILVASSGYIATNGRPDHLAAVRDHACVIISGRGGAGEWWFSEEAGPIRADATGAISTDSAVGARALVLAGAGIALLPDWLVKEELKSGEVLQLLPTAVAKGVPLCAVTPLSRRHSARVSIFLDYLSQQLGIGSA
jgi:DNA-binding transcriptional LysR family regulator